MDTSDPPIFLSEPQLLSSTRFLDPDRTLLTALLFFTWDSEYPILDFPDGRNVAGLSQKVLTRTTCCVVGRGPL